MSTQKEIAFARIEKMFNEQDNELSQYAVWQDLLENLRKKYGKKDIRLEAVKLMAIYSFSLVERIGKEEFFSCDPIATSARKICAYLHISQFMDYSDAVWVLDTDWEKEEETEKPFTSMEALEKRLQEIKEELALLSLRNQVAELKEKAALL